MFYTYILYSSKSKDFYYGWTSDLKQRLKEHNSGFSWKLVWFGAFQTIELAKDFEEYLKSGSGKSFAYKRLLNTVALKRDKRAR